MEEMCALLCWHCNPLDADGSKTVSFLLSIKAFKRVWIGSTQDWLHLVKLWLSLGFFFSWELVLNSPCAPEVTQWNQCLWYFSPSCRKSDELIRSLRPPFFSQMPFPKHRCLIIPNEQWVDLWSRGIDCVVSMDDFSFCSLLPTHTSCLIIVYPPRHRDLLATRQYKGCKSKQSILSWNTRLLKNSVFWLVWMLYLLSFDLLVLLEVRF